MKGKETVLPSFIKRFSFAETCAYYFEDLRLHLKLCFAKTPRAVSRAFWNARTARKSAQKIKGEQSREAAAAI